MSRQGEGSLFIGWAQTEITPKQPVLIRGYSYARVSEGVLDPLTATVMVLVTHGENDEVTQTTVVSCDIISISDELRDKIREKTKRLLPELDTRCIVINATHTHNAPEHRCEEDSTNLVGIALSDLGVMEPADYIEDASDQIAEAIVSAYNARKPGGISWGLGSVVVSHNRISSFFGSEHTGEPRITGRSAFSTGAARQGPGPYSIMYGNTNDPDFSHMEGYVDHSLDLLCTWDEASKLTGVIVNLPCPSQVGGAPYQLTADFWDDTRKELRHRHGEALYVLPQCGPAGDQNSLHPYRKAAEERMLALSGRSKRREIAIRIANAVDELIPWMAKSIDRSPDHVHRVENVPLSKRMVTEEEMKEARAELPTLRIEFERTMETARTQRLDHGTTRWYTDSTRAFWLYRRALQVIERYESQDQEKKHMIEVHAVRLGEMAMATNPFELYLDFGLQIQARSAAVQTFLVQLAGPGTYVPTRRSVKGGAYGAVPASSVVGPEGGRELVKQTVRMIEELWENDGKVASN